MYPYIYENYLLCTQCFLVFQRVSSKKIVNQTICLTPYFQLHHHSLLQTIKLSFEKTHS